MKIHICLFFICLTINCAYPQGWFSLESNTSTYLSDVYFLNSEIGFVVGRDGLILKTSNGGSDWGVKPSGVTRDLLSICFPDSLTGFAVTESQLLKTNDGGETWFVQDTVSFGTGLAEIQFIGQDTGFVMGNSKMLMTLDKGENWTKKVGPRIGPVYSFWATDTKNLYTGGPEFIIVKSADSGDSWEISLDYQVGVGDCDGMFFTSKTEGYAVGSSTAYGSTVGVIRKTLNGGESWSSYPVEGHIFYSVFFINDKTGFVVGYPGCILKTNDGGASWNNSISGLQTDLTSVFFTNSLTGYAVGSNGTILKTTDGGLSIPSSRIHIPAVKFFPNPASEKLHIELNNPRIQHSEILIYTLSGSLIRNYVIAGNNIILDLCPLQSGTYIVNITNKEYTHSFKFQKQ